MVRSGDRSQRRRLQRRAPVRDTMMMPNPRRALDSGHALYRRRARMAYPHRMPTEWTALMVAALPHDGN